MLRSLCHHAPLQVMVTLGEAGKSEELLDFWRQLVCLQGIEGVSIRPDTFFLAMRHAVKVKAWDEVEAIIGMLQVLLLAIFLFGPCLRNKVNNTEGVPPYTSVCKSFNSVAAFAVHCSLVS